jgi:hypothetical protein
MFSSGCRLSPGLVKFAAQTGKLVKKFSYRRVARDESCAVCRLRNIWTAYNKVSLLHQKPRNRFAHNRIRRNVNCRPNSFRVVVQPLVLGDLRFSPKVQGDARKFLLIFWVWTWVYCLPTSTAVCVSVLCATCWKYFSHNRNSIGKVLEPIRGFEGSRYHSQNRLNFVHPESFILFQVDFWVWRDQTLINFIGES